MDFKGGLIPLLFFLITYWQYKKIVVFFNSTQNIGELNMKKIILTSILLTGIMTAYNFINDELKLYNLQKLNQIEVNRCSMDMATNPDLICD